MNKVSYTTLAIILSLSIIGARLQNNYILYTMLILICVYVGLVAFDKIKNSHYPYAIFVIGLALLFQSTLMSNGLVGTDIHSEYYYSLQALNGWNASIPNSYNSCIGSVLIAPALQNWFGINMIWTYKVIFPLLFAFTAPLLYLIFKKEFGNKTAFLGTFFFVSLPVWMIEMIGVPRQMLAELMLVTCAYLIIVSDWKMRIKVSLICICVALGAMFHYVALPTIIAYLGVCTVFTVFFRKRVFPTKWLLVILVTVVTIGGLWYGLTSSGVALTSIIYTIKSSLGIAPTTSMDIVRQQATEAGRIVTFTDSATPLIQTALGFDFMKASLTGKVFRVFQYATEILIAVGCISIARHWRKYTPEYLGFVLTGLILAVIAIFVPMSVTIIGTTRAYHLIMLFVSPAVIIGGLIVFRNYKWLTVCLLIPYFLICSGVLFEATQCEDISTVDTPYSIALSHERLDIGGIATDNDITMRDWAVNNSCEPVFMDINGELLFMEMMGSDEWYHISYITIEVKDIEDGFALLPKDANELPSKCYIFLREWNIQNKLLTFKPSWDTTAGEKTGMRTSVSFDDIKLNDIIEASTIAYRKGDAIIYEYNAESN